MTGDVFKNIYAAQSGLADQIYGANKENIAASYAAQQAVGQGVSDIGKATSGALMGMSNVSAAQQGLAYGAGGPSTKTSTAGAFGDFLSSALSAYGQSQSSQIANPFEGTKKLAYQ
jgi:hypothetical protein